VSIRVLQAIGVGYAQDYITRFGFGAAQHPPYLTMALGAGSVTPWQMAAAYSIFANGGYKVAPYFIDKIYDPQGKLVAQTNPQKAGESAERVIDGRNSFLMSSLLGDVVRAGTATKAMKLGRNDLAGKTGTTNDLIDAWFAGFQRTLVGIAWIGYDTPRTLGNSETGGQAALPIWIDYMAKALQNVPEAPPTPPEGVVAIKINAGNGLPDPEGTLTEFYYQESPPKPRNDGLGGEQVDLDDIKNQLF